VKEVILVPRRDDNGPRDELWEWCRAWWEREQSHMPIVEGYHTDGLFNRSAAVNRAAKLAGDWDVAVIIDSDVICNPQRVKEAVLLAHETGSMVLPHDNRKDLSPAGSQRVRRGYDGNWDSLVHRTYSVENGHPSVSSVVVISRRQWDLVGGFDEDFRGWGYEDTAFAAACETFGGVIRMPGEVWHLWHPTAREGKRGTRSWSHNSTKGQRYRTAIGNPDAIRALQAEGRKATTEVIPGGIPRILHRTVPETPDPVADGWWAMFEEMHPDWTLMTHRDPLEPREWPETSRLWSACTSGAQLADLIRLEALWRWGGIYVDSDVQPLRPLDSLLPLSAFAGYEDRNSIPNAVLGATPGHPAIRACLDLIATRIPGPTWEAGPGVTTEVLTGRSDVVLLPPEALYPVHYKDKRLQLASFDPACHPWSFTIHHWAGSWLPEAKRW
jgi:hypothetical protein